MTLDRTKKYRVGKVVFRWRESGNYGVWYGRCGDEPKGTITRMMLEALEPEEVTE